MKSRRQLTRGEEKLSRAVFGSAINYRNVQVISGNWKKQVAVTPFGSVYFPKASIKADFVGNDLYSQVDVSDKTWFLHEMVHVWQHYVGMSVILLAARAHAKGKGNLNAVYGYTLQTGTDLMEYNIEQQADIIADYFAWKLWQQPLPQSKSLYDSVLDQFFHDAAYPINERWIRQVRSRIRSWER